MKKRIISCLFIMALVISVACVKPASAQTSSNVYSGVTVTTTCNSSSSNHTQKGSSSICTAKLYYTLNGELKTAIPSMTYPGSNSWSASISCSGSAYKATTTYNSYVVTAVYP